MSLVVGVLISQAGVASTDKAAQTQQPATTPETKPGEPAKTAEKKNAEPAKTAAVKAKEQKPAETVKAPEKKTSDTAKPSTAKAAEPAKPAEPAKASPEAAKSAEPGKASAEAAKPAGAATETAKKSDDNPPEKAYDPKKFVGVAVTGASGKLEFVAENPSQTHSRDNYVWVHVKGIKMRSKEKGRIRIAVWDSAANYAQEGKAPFRASSHWAKDSQNGEMMFKIGGLEVGKNYSFFAHFDKEDRGYVKKFLGIPVDPFIFSNTKNQGKGEGLTREGLSPPKFESTLVNFTTPGQEVVMQF